MDSMPLEILVQIISNLQLGEKHVVMRVNHTWKEAAIIAIVGQRLLIVYNERPSGECCTRVCILHSC
jgi:hypothetical protein